MNATIRKLPVWTKAYKNGFRFIVTTEDQRYSECVHSLSLARAMVRVLAGFSAADLERIEQVEQRYADLKDEAAAEDLESALWDLAYDRENEEVN